VTATKFGQGGEDGAWGAGFRRASIPCWMLRSTRATSMSPAGPGRGRGTSIRTTPTSTARPGDIDNSLKKNAGGDWTESFPDGFKYNYTSSGLASSIVSPSGFRNRLRRRGRAGASFQFSVFSFQWAGR